MPYSSLVGKWVPDIVAGLCVLLLGFGEAFVSAYSGLSATFFPWLVTCGLAGAVVLVRHAGWYSLAILWLVFIGQALSVTDIMIVEIAVLGVAFGLSFWGSRSLLWGSGLSIPLATLSGIGYITQLQAELWDTRIARNLIIPIINSGAYWEAVFPPLIAAALALPWLGGLAARYGRIARLSRRSLVEAEASALRSDRERKQMAEIVLLRESQAQLARDVHDVVGHSLTVILAQAESGQFIKDNNVNAFKETLATIANSARSSLKEVRAVLSSPEGDRTYRTDLDSLVEDTRSSGCEIDMITTGEPRPLPPELATVSFRVLQEMLTNALKHGSPGLPISVVCDWAEHLRITVTNEIVQGEGASESDGKGIEGMRRRLESIGGSLVTSCVSGSTFTSVAVLPVRASGMLGTVT